MAKYAALLLIFLMVAGFEPVAKCLDVSVFGSVTKYAGYAGNAFKIGMTAFEDVQKLYGVLQPKTAQESESDQKLDPGMEQRITDQVKKVSKQISSLKVNLKNVKHEIIDTILTELPEKLRLKKKLDTIYYNINVIENLYQNFGDYVTNPKNFSIETLEDFAKTATSHHLTALPNLLKTIHWELVNTDSESGESILSILSKNTQSPTTMCNRQQSLQQMLFTLYDTIIAADIKGHTMIQYGFMLLETIKGGKRSTEMVQARQHFATRISNTLQSVKKAMASASRVVWKCDNGYKEDVTYTKFNNFVHRYMVNEADINNEETCKYECPKYSGTQIYDCYDKDSICNKQRTCDGEIWDCEVAPDEMWICPSEETSNRRYEYIEYGNSQRYGPKGTCKNPVVTSGGWRRGFYHCTSCMCTCDDVNYAESDRYVNLREVNSDFTNQYVVTGVRLRKVNHVLHLQIQQGQLLPGGLIDESTVHWKEIDAYKLGYRIPSTIGTKDERTPVERLDFATLKYKHTARLPTKHVQIRMGGFNLDDFDFVDEKPDANYVLVGVQFNYTFVKDSDKTLIGEHVVLETLMSPFNFTTGKIDYDHLQVYSKCRGDYGYPSIAYKSDKIELKLEDDIPTEGAGAVPNSQTNQFLYLKPSSMDTDAGQNTIPFLDIQDVETYPHVPLSGVGLFHKSSPGTGGFLALKLFTYNYEPNLG